MALWWVINKETLEMIASGDDSFKERCSIGPDQEWLEVPEGVAPGNCKVELVPEVPAEGETPAVPEYRHLVDGSLDKGGPMWDAMRAMRNAKLSACDWTQLADSPLSVEDKALWATYRQALRDLPEISEDPEDITWPEQP